MKAFLAGLAALAFAVLVFQWAEAGVEVRVLCANVAVGQDVDAVRAMFATGHRLRLAGDPASGTLEVSSSWDLGQSRCRVASSDGRVTEVEGMRGFHLPAAAGALGLVLVGGLMAVQGGLAAGAPWGRAAWGGRHPGRLPAGLRVASGAVVLALVPAAWALAVRSWVGRTPPWPVAPAPGWTEIVAFAFALVFALSAAGNALSKSPVERRFMVPVAVLLAACFWVVAWAR